MFSMLEHLEIIIHSDFLRSLRVPREKLQVPWAAEGVDLHLVVVVCGGDRLVFFEASSLVN